MLAVIHQGAIIQLILEITISPNKALCVEAGFYQIQSHIHTYIYIYVILIPQPRVLCLIYTHVGTCVCIRQSMSACGISAMYHIAHAG